jgi:hypothetical protein
MTLPLKYNAASQTIILGPFLDDTDGKTPETALSIANTDIKLKKHNGTSDTNKNSGGATHIANGYYYCTLDATDTNTIGRLTISVNMSGALPVWHEFIVYPAEAFDYLFAAAGTDYMKVDVAQWLGTNAASPATAGIPKVAIEAAGDFAQGAADKAWSTAARTLTAFAQSFSDQVWSSTTRTLTALGSGLVAEIWNALTSGMSTVGSIGKKLADWVVGTIDTYTGNTKQTGDAYARLGAPAGASVSADIAAVKADTAAILLDTGTDGVVVPQAQADKVWGTATRALTDKAGFSLSAAGIDDIFDEVITGHVTADTFGLYLARLYQYFNHKLNITDATGAAALRNAGDSANIATWTITDDDTTTVRGAASWI